MSWIKENKFIASLGGGTLVGVIILAVVGYVGSSHYDQAQESYSTAKEEASGYEKKALYPKSENKAAKSKALGEYRQTLDSLQGAFEPFRPKEIKNISPQDFTDNLLKANTDVRKAFEDAGTVVPEPFFVGFERYKTSLASGNTTGVLGYELDSIKGLMLELAKAKVGELKNLYRPTLLEEEGSAYTPAESAVSRPFPLEITFTGTEKSVREFFSSIAKPENQYVVIRTVRIASMKKDPPRATDAQFEKPATAAPAAGGADAFSGGFVLPGDDTAAPAAASDKAAAAPAAAKPADSSRILSQVLGLEQVQVFVRLDLLEFLPAKKLP
jgi:hypothetical protein